MKMDTNKIGLLGCSAIVAGNIIGSGIALLPADLASIGSIILISWMLASIGALSLAYVFAVLGTIDPEPGGPVAYAEQISPVIGYQTSMLYFNANWIGNLAIAITGVSYLSVFFHVLKQPLFAGFVTIVFVWLLTGINIIGVTWISRLVSIGVFLLLIPVLLTAIVGWFYFSPATFHANWNVSHYNDFYAISKGIVLSIWSFVGLESASVNAGIVRNPFKTIPIATMIGTSIAALVYTTSTTVMLGMFPAGKIAHADAPFSMVNAFLFGHWADPCVSAIAAFACFASLGSWLMLVAQAGIRGAQDGMLPKVFGHTNKKGIPVKGLIVLACFMTALMLVLMLFSDSAQKLFSHIISIAVLLVILPYFFSAIRLIHIAKFNLKSITKIIISIIACVFCFTAFAGVNKIILASAFIASLGSFIFYIIKDRNDFENRINEKNRKINNEI